MIFKTTTINPKGRNKYGSYLSSTDVAHRVLSINNGGNTSTPTTPITTIPTTPSNSFNVALSKTQGTFEWQQIVPDDGQIDIIYAFGFNNMDRVPTFIGDISKSEEEAYNGIKGLAGGMEVVVENNGTSATTISVIVTEDIDPKQGTLTIPVTIYTGNVSGPEGPVFEDWYKSAASCKTLWLTYTYMVLSNTTARWINTNVSQILYNPNNDAISPLQVEARVFKQEGNQNPVIDTATTIFYGWDTFNPTNYYTRAIPTRGDANYLTLGLKNSNGVFYETLTIPVVKYGNDGLQGKAGASIRGPIDWGTVTTSRRFCNGVYDESLTSSLPGDALYIDIVKWQNKTYRCITSFDFEEGDAWTDWQDHFEESTDYDFVATNLLLAENAKINFATNNELYLTDSQGNVTAGAAGGNGINFWAGAPEPNANIAAWSVDNAGNMIAKKGTFGNLSISEDEFGNGVIVGEFEQKTSEGWEEDVISNIKLQPFYLGMTSRDTNDSTGASETYVKISSCKPSRSEAGDMNAFIEVNTNTSGTSRSFFTDGRIDVGNITLSNYNSPSSLKSPSITRSFKNPVDDNSFNITETALFSPLNLRIIAITDSSSMFTKVNGQWHFCGINLDLSSTMYPNIRKDQAEGYWEVYNGSLIKNTGVASSTTPKQNNCIYIRVDTTKEIWFGRIKIV